MDSIKTDQLYFEWIYTQFVSSNIFVNILIHKTDMFGISKEPYLSVSYFTKEGHSGHRRYPLSQDEYGSFFHRYDDNSYRVKVRLEPIEIDGIFFSAEHEHPVQEDLAGASYLHSSFWHVLVPQGDFQGEIRYQNAIHATSAVVYQDMQFGKLPIQQFLKKWGWSVVVDDNKTYGRFSILAKSGFEQTIEFCSDGVNLSKSTKQVFEASWVNSLCPNTDAVEDNTHLPGVDIDVQNPIRSRTHEKYEDFFMTYYRYACTHNGLICGVCEYMEIEEEK